MKKFLFPTGGQKVNLTDIKDLHDELININEALLIGVGGCVLSGILVSGTQGSANISAGWCYLDGEYVYLPAQSGINFTANPNQYITKAAAVESRPKNFVTGGVKNTRSTKNATIVTTQPISGDYITMKFEGHSQSYVEVIGRKIIPVKTILEIASSEFFDQGTGLGSGSWKGWAMADGRNGTVNKKGRFTVGYDSTDNDYNAIGKTGGAKTVTLTEAQLPSHFHVIANNNNAGIRNNQLSDNEFLGLTADYGNSQFNHILAGTTNTPNTGRTGSSGSGESHENRPPFITGFFVQKIF